MSDRELLELAAKAAGIAIQRSRLEDPMWRDMLLVERHKDHSGVAVDWNPLTNDGDALRLAVKLRIIPHMDNDGVSTGYEHVTTVRRPYFAPIYEAFGPDEFAATRRAIVRAAAEIGKNMGT